jgi:hypothetical protein
MRHFVIILSLLIVTCTTVVAQPGDPNEDPDVPITGIEILLIAGGALGIRKLVQHKKKHSE